MSRTIKFRCWDDNAKKMFELDVLRLRQLNDETAVLSKPVMQFTGLHDKNGKEIYEGDILRYENKNSKGWTNKYHLRQVIWNEAKSGFQLKKIPKRYDFKVLIPALLRAKQELKYTIIGNIYENPELLPPSHPKE